MASENKEVELPPIPTEEIRFGCMARGLLELYYEWLEQGEPLRSEPQPTT